MLTPSQVQALEQTAFAEGVSPENLMEEAGGHMARAVRQFFPGPGVCVAFFGKGHNGGDALVVARLLAEAGWRVTLVPAYAREQWAPLTALKWDQAGRCETRPAEELEAGWRPDPQGGEPLVVLDGLLGVGASGALRDPVASLSRRMNAWREDSSARVFALDLPTGLDGDTGLADKDAVVADVTLTVGVAKRGLLADCALPFVGRLAVMPLGEISKRLDPALLEAVATPSVLAPLWKRRPWNLHKGDCGRVVLVAGSCGMTGAACLAAQGALRAGAGLVTLAVPEPVYGTVAKVAPQECMVVPVNDLREVLDWRADALGIGPGLGAAWEAQVLEVIRDFPKTAVVDADALNCLARAGVSLLADCAGPRVLTPHPGEMERLQPAAEGALSRRGTVAAFTSRWPVTLLLKGARTLVGSGGARFSYNTTGSPGMASGGMGDVLTGVIAALLAQGLDGFDAARLGAWLCGRSAEGLLNAGKRSEESLLAGDVASGLGRAFVALRERSY